MISPGIPLFAFFCLAGARTLRAGGADSVKPCPTIGGHPKGVGLEGIRGASYARTVPAKQKRVLNLSGTGNKLQVKILADYDFHGFSDLAVQPSLKPRDGKPICYEYQGCSVCNVYKRCSGKPIRCLSRGQVFCDLFSGVLPDSLMLSVWFFFFFILCVVLSVMSGDILFPPGGHVLLPLSGFSGYILLWLSGYGLGSLIFFSGDGLGPLNPCDHLIELLPDHLEAVGVFPASPHDGNNSKAEELSARCLL